MDVLESWRYGNSVQCSTGRIYRAMAIISIFCFSWTALCLCKKTFSSLDIRPIFFQAIIYNSFRNVIYRRTYIHSNVKYQRKRNGHTITGCNLTLFQEFQCNPPYPMTVSHRWGVGECSSYFYSQQWILLKGICKKKKKPM